MEKVDLSYCLSDYQLEVLHDICDGLKRREIAKKHHKSIKSIDHVISVLYEKLGCNSHVDLFKVLYGFLPVPEKPKIATEKTLENIIRLHEMGLKPRLIAERTGYDRKHVYHVLSTYKAVKRAKNNPDKPG
ncbi:helix-turn-helix DNA binding domain protein [Anabaena phage Elbi]|nr:helix-turn-helix DNA binding domain protein [Anabaena phage Elbi]